MWTWQFQLDDILTTLSIVAIIGGASYRLLILPSRVDDIKEELHEHTAKSHQFN